MAGETGFRIFKGYNYRVLQSREFDPICFGCPPGIVKDFSRRNADLPSHYVLPLQTFGQGRSHFDFEFIVYSFLFIKPTREVINVYCTEDQRDRFKVILKETLFGPSLENLMLAQCRRLGIDAGLTTQETSKYRKLLVKVARDKKLRGTFNQLLKSQVREKEILKFLEDYFKNLLKKNLWFARKKIERLPQKMARHYLLCAQMKNEMDLFVVYKEISRDEFINRLVRFHLFDKSGSVSVASGKDKRKRLKIFQDGPGRFQVRYQKSYKKVIDIYPSDALAVPQSIQPLEKPYMGVTYLGVGSGFTHKRKNSCLILWSEGKGIMVDSHAENRDSLLSNGVTEEDVPYLFLSHVHSDHDSGIIEMILSGQRVRLISTRIIFESFLRKMGGITGYPPEHIEKFVDIFEVEPDKKYKLPGFKNTYLEFDYSLHSIPSGRFRLSYRNPSGKDRVISHSGDTKYDVELIQQWSHEGIFSVDRMNRILNFIWDADLIIHEVGGSVLHTEFSALTYLEPAITRKMVLVHQHKEPFPHPYFRFAEEGRTDVLIKSKPARKRLNAEMLQETEMFRKAKRSEIDSLLKKAQILNLNSERVVFSDKKEGEAFYMILEGFVQASLNKSTSTIYGKGMFFGKDSSNGHNPNGGITVRTLSPVKLLKIPLRHYEKSWLPKRIDRFYDTGNYFNQFIRPGLLVSLGFGDLVHWSRGERIVPTREGETSNFIIISGQVKISDSRRKSVAFLESGDIIGKLSNMKPNDKAVSRASAESDQVWAVRLSPEQLTQLFKLYPSFGDTACQRLQTLDACLTR